MHGDYLGGGYWSGGYWPRYGTGDPPDPEPAPFALLTAPELAMLRETALLALPDVATRIVRSGPGNAQGGRRRTETATASYPCELSPLQGVGESLEAGRPASVTLWRLRLPWDATLEPRDVVLVGGTRYEVTDRQAGRSTQITLVCTVRRAE